MGAILEIHFKSISILFSMLIQYRYPIHYNQLKLISTQYRQYKNLDAFRKCDPNGHVCLVAAWIIMSLVNLSWNSASLKFIT